MDNRDALLELNAWASRTARAHDLSLNDIIGLLLRHASLLMLTATPPGAHAGGCDALMTLLTSIYNDERSKQPPSV